MEKMDQSRDRVLGCILGQAIGDALGEPSEFSASFPRELPGISPLNNRFTDDTQMMAAIAKALLAVPPAPDSNEGFMVELCKRFVEWGNNPLGGSHRAPGRACMQAVRNLQDGVPWNRAGGLSAKGNGSAMRSSVVGSYYQRDLDTAWRIGCLTSVPTHNNLEPILCAGVVSLLCASGIAGLSWPEAFRAATERVENWRSSVPCYPQEVPLGAGFSNHDPDCVASHLTSAFNLARTDVTDGAFTRENGNDFATVPATAAAIFFNTRYHSFREIIENCALWTGDCDTTTAIAGAIAGSRFGAVAIPAEWRRDIENDRLLPRFSGSHLAVIAGFATPE
jgi:ADP-ribosylglycohydrolase